LLVRYLKPHGDAPQEDVAGAADRLRHRMQGRSLPLAPRKQFESTGSATVRWVPRVAAAAFLVAAIGTAILWRPADAALYRIVEGDVHEGGTIRSNGSGAVLSLIDGSRIEMKSKSELSLERADDGVRIRLARGGVIVNAARQRAGHLYVQTKDVTVSVVGTVFLVNAEEQGSRVAVIEGEVRVVQQGETEKNLLPGQQVATSPSMAPAPITDEISWSRNAGNHLALLQQSTVAPPPTRPADVSTEARDAFEAVSVRLAPPLFGGARDGSPPGSPGPARLEPGAPCIGIDLQVDARRYAARSIPVTGLITQAFGRTCQTRDQIVGGPAWVRMDGFDIEATLPMGSPAYTAMHVRQGAAPRLQLMLQAMLADRFKLVLRRDVREMAVYNLVVANAGKLKPSADQQNPPGPSAMTFPAGSPPGPWVASSFTTMATLASTLQMVAGRPVIDRTELKGRFDIWIQFTNPGGLSGAALQAAEQDQLPSALEEQLGLRLEPARGPVEFLVIERIERPSEN
jgi:uncharacterized protein (TIGR03435 family)